jgi:cell pole-organizing protein PopZ
MSVPDDHGTTPSGQAAQGGDPSMEDILASIRRILSEDETGSPAPEPANAGESGDDVFVLDPSMMVPDQRAEAAGQRPADNAASPQNPAEGSEPPASSLVAPAAAAAAASSVGSLVRTLSTRNPQVYDGGPTLEDMVRDELRPLVKDWLDANLPSMVERLVRSEIERVVGRTEH